MILDKNEVERQMMFIKGFRLSQTRTGIGQNSNSNKGDEKHE